MFQFLSQLFNQLNKEKIIYCLLKNYQELPEKVGNDVDIWIKDGEQKKFQRILFRIAKNLKWGLIEFSPRLSCQGEGDYFFVKDDAKTEVLHIDCWTFLHWRGMAYINEKIFPHNLLFYKKSFYIPSPGLEGGILLFKDLIYQKKVMEKYKSWVFENINRDSEIFLESIKKPFGRKTAKLILNAVENERWEELEKKCIFFRWSLLKNSFFNNPFLQLKHWFLYSCNRFKKYLFPKTGIFLVLFGPDGSGKSTSAQNLLESKTIKRLFQKRLYFHGHFHFLPELKKFTSFLKIDSKRQNPVTVKSPQNYSQPFGIFRSAIYPFYYGFNYFLGHPLIWKEKASGGLVIFDRYFYDYLIQKQYGKCPRWLLFLIAKFIPKPDIIIYLENNPEVIHIRKPELSLEEIERQSKVCKEIIKHFPNGFIIETSSEAEQVAEEIQRIIIEKIKEKQKL